MRIAVWLTAIVIAAVSFGRLAVVSLDQLRAPFDLISEGPHMSTIKAIRDGYDIYNPASYLDLPFFMTPYTPLYHIVVALLPAPSANPFFTGRLVAMLCMLGAAANLFAVGRPGRPTAARSTFGVGTSAPGAAPSIPGARGSMAAALLAVAVFFLIRPVTGNTAYLRSDSTALLFSVWAVVAAARTLERSRDAPAPQAASRLPPGVVLPALLSVLAVASKQSFLAAPLTCFISFLWHDRRRALAFALAGAAFALPLALAAHLYWGPEFWLTVTVPMTDYPRDWESFLVHWRMMWSQPVFVVLVGAGVAVLAVALSGGVPGLVGGSPYFLYMTVAWAVQTSVLTGIGAENHNLIEPVLASLLWITDAVRRLVGAPRGADTARPFAAASHGTPTRGTALGLTVACTLALAVLASAVVLELTRAERSEFSYTTAEHTSQYVRDREEIARALRTLGIENGRFLNIKNSQVTHDFAGQMHVNDPWMYITVLWNSRPITVDRLSRAIEARYFDAVLVAPGLVSARGQTTDAPAQRLIRTIFRHYELKVRGNEVNVLTPIGGGLRGERPHPLGGGAAR